MIKHEITQVLRNSNKRQVFQAEIRYKLDSQARENSNKKKCYFFNPHYYFFYVFFYELI